MFHLPELQQRHGVCNHCITAQTGWLVSPWWAKTLLPAETRVLCYGTWNLKMKYVSPRRSRFSNVLKPPNLSCGDSQWPEKISGLDPSWFPLLTVWNGPSALQDFCSVCRWLSTFVCCNSSSWYPSPCLCDAPPIRCITWLYWRHCEIKTQLISSMGDWLKRECR